MAISSTEQTKIINLLIGMFNAVPGSTNLDAIIDFYEENNNDLSLLAEELSSLSLFSEQFDELTDTLISEIIISNFGMTTSTTFGEIAHTFVLSELINGKSEWEIIKEAVDYFTSGDADSMFDDVVSLLNNKTEVAEYYSITLARSSTNFSDLQSVLSNVTEDYSSVAEVIDELLTSKLAVINSITIPDGNYTFGGDLNITITFDDDIILNGVDSTLTLNLGGIEKEASLYSYTNNTITYKYVIEDGYFSEDATVLVSENGLNLNSSTITDAEGLKANLDFQSSENTLAVISDLKAPEYTLYSAHYDSNTNTLILSGTGFNSILESDENASLDIGERIDFTKLVWDFNSDDLNTSDSTLVFDSSNVISSKIQNDNQLVIVLSNEVLLESDENYGLVNENDSIDVLEGFLKDKAENISLNTMENDLLLGIDNNITGNSDANILYGTINDDIITSYASNDVLYGKEGNDRLYGGSENDILIGGTGIDTLVGGSGKDTFIFSENDTLPLFGSTLGIDIIIDLNINSSSEDLIDLDIDVVSINNSVSGSVNQETFISDMNTLLNVVNSGFNKLSENDISASIVNVTQGDFQNKTYLVVDYNANNNFDTNDFIVDITGATISNLSTDSFI